MKKITLSIPQPCHEDWKKMTPAEKGRFCGACQKTVVDFSSMSDRELLHFFQKQQTGVCGRFQLEQLDRAIVKPKTPWPYAKYFFQALLPAFLMSLKSTAQERRLGRVAVCKPVMQGDTIVAKPISPPEPIATGSVTDANGIGIPYASLTLEKSRKGVLCDSVGGFEIYDAELFEKPIVVSAVGYESKTVNLKKGAAIALTLNNLLSGEVVMTGYVVASPARKRKPANLIPLIATSAKPETHFTVYPNPVRSGATVTINWKDVEAGDYVMQLQSAAGQHLLSAQALAPLQNNRYKFQLPQLVPGVYVMAAINKKTGTVYSEKITVY